ncbi:MAG: hypothetical protein OFPII_18200 [Osedax symbiont Rs1]|nr:MAG: hypothetical protein OFPII_18200 [Osedax symbiont Rs1]
MPQQNEFASKELSIVLIGGFNPLNYTPDWLHQFGLISQKDKDNHTIVDVSLDHIIVELTWCTIKVVRTPNSDKLNLTLTDDSSITKFKDLIFSIVEFSDTTKMSAIGLNFNRTIQHSSTDEWHAFGNRLTPKSIWLDAFADIQKQSGMRKISIVIHDIYPSLDDGINESPELNIEVRPLFSDSNGTILENASIITLNYHFSISNDSNISYIKDVLDTYLYRLNSETDVKVRNLLQGE